MEKDLILESSSRSLFSPLLKQEEEHLPQIGRFTILSPEEREQGLAKAQENISPSGITGFFIKMGRAIAGWFFSEKAQLKSARALLEKPTVQLTAAINFITRFNGLLAGKTDKFASMTFENFNQYITALQNKQLLIVDKESESGFTAVNPSEIFEDRIDQMMMQFFQFELKDEMRELGPQLIDVGNSLAKYHSLTPNQVLTEAQKTVNAWRTAIQTVGATVSDAEFRGLVTKASQNLGAKVSDPDFVQAQAVSDWARSGQQNFVNEAAQTFAEAVKSIKEQAGPEETDQNIEALTTLLRDIDTRAQNIGTILGNEETEEIKETLLKMLNEVPEFRTALETAQADLREVVRTNQSVEDLTATGMSGVVAGQTGIIEAEKTLEKSTLKGEAAIAATFGALLQPDVVLNTLMVTGLSKEEAIEKVAKDFPEHANLAVDTFASTDRELAGVLYENDRIIAEGQARAEVALQKLDLLNHFVSKSQEETMSINVEAQNKPIQLPQTKEDRQAFIGQELKEAFLERFELLAGTSDEEAHPTLLAQLIGQLGEAGTMAVLGEAIRPEDIFISKKTTGGQELTHKETTLATFKASEEQDPRGIDLLRQKIKQNRTEIELAKRQHLDSQELELRLVDLESSRVQVQSSGGNRFTRFFRNLFGRSNPQEQQLLESPLMSGQHTPRYFEPLSKVGSKRGSFVDLRDLESSQMMMKPKSQMRRIHSSGNLLDLEVDLQQLSSPLKQPVHKHEQEIDLEEEE